MKKILLPFKLRLILPVFSVVIAITAGLSLWHIKTSVDNFNKQLENTLALEVQTIYKMFERESILKLENVKKNLRVASSLFEEKELVIHNNVRLVNVKNQYTAKEYQASIKEWTLDNKKVYGDTCFVDDIYNLLGGTVTIFQKIDNGLLRIATNVKKDDGTRAVGTYIPSSSPVAQAVMQGETYYGRAFVVNDWYTTAYKPIYKDNAIVGALYVGDKEKDLPQLKAIIKKLKFGESGYPFVFLKDGYMLIHPYMEDQVYENPHFFESVEKNTEGILYYTHNDKKKSAAYRYFEPFDLYIAATVYNREENRAFIRSAIIGTAVVSFVALLIMLGFIYYFTSDKLYKYIVRMQISNRKIATITEELKESEERFQKLFDSTGDDIFVTDVNENIVEVNNAACKSLGYSREELMRMKITDIKTPKYKSSVADNRKKIFNRGSYAFESEHITKDGHIMTVEFASRVVSYKNEKFILSVVRNISQRKEFERKVLSAVIKAEERERERFAKDMHDGLGPLLSTVKLYVNELKSMTLSEEERHDFIKTSNELLDEAVNATRTISNNLMPRIISSYGLVKAVDDFCKKVNKTNKLNISFETENILQRLHPDIELILFRVITELINNTIKHAKAEKIIILLVRYDNRIALYYKDDGIGFNTREIMTDAQKGMGLKNIISRVKSINGLYEFGSSPGNGFTIKIEFDI